jgi:hypothetical protein
MERLFKLKGASVDHEDLVDLFPAGSATVKKIDQEYYLQIPESDSSQDDNEALGLAETALTRMSAIAMVKQENFQPPTIEGIARRDAATGRLSRTHIIRPLGIAPTSRLGTPTLTRAAEIPSSDQSPSFGEAALSIADKNGTLERALQVYGTRDEHTWRGLYLVYEATKEGNGGKNGLIALSVAPWSKIDNFTATANSYRAIGVQARHSSKSKGNSPAKMTLDEARTLIRQLLEAWIRKLLGRT